MTNNEFLDSKLVALVFVKGAKNRLLTIRNKLLLGGKMEEKEILEELNKAIEFLLKAEMQLEIENRKKQ